MSKHFWIIIYIGLFLASCTHGESVQLQEVKSAPPHDMSVKKDNDILIDTVHIDIPQRIISYNTETIIPETEEQFDLCDFSSPNVSNNTVLHGCYFKRGWDDSLIPNYPTEEDNSVIQIALKHVKSTYKYRAELIAGEWVLFDRDFSEEEHYDEDLPVGKYKFLVHKDTGVVKKRDYYTLGHFLKSFNVLDTPAINYYLLISMVSAILDDNSYVISDNNRLKFANDIRLSLEKKALMIDYWNMDNAGGYGFKEYFTHHILTIDKDYHVTEEKESFVATADDFKRLIHCFSAKNCTEEDNISNYIVTPGSFIIIRKEAPPKATLSPSPSLDKIIEDNKKDNALKWCTPTETGSEIQRNSISYDCLIEFSQWNESFEPREPNEQDNDVINAASQLFNKTYPTRVIYVTGNWVLFDRVFLNSDPFDADIPWGKYRTLVHTQKGVIKKNDLNSLAILFADLKLYDSPFNLNHDNLMDLIAAVLDNNTEVIYTEKGIDWITKSKIKKEKNTIVIDYWNKDNSGEIDEFYTHHVITITKDYKVTETRKTFDSSGNEIK